MNASNYSRFIKSWISNVEKSSGAILKNSSVLVLDQTIQRSKISGINSSGIEGNKVVYSRGKISTKRLYPFLNEAGRSYVKSLKKSKQKGSWFDFRYAQGKGNFYINLDYRGRFWKSLSVRRRSNLSCFVTSSDDKKKVTSLFKDFGPFLMPTKKEAEFQGEYIKKKLFENFQKL